MEVRPREPGHWEDTETPAKKLLGSHGVYHAMVPVTDKCHQGQLHVLAHGTRWHCTAGLAPLSAWAAHAAQPPLPSVNKGRDCSSKPEEIWTLLAFSLIWLPCVLTQKTLKSSTERLRPQNQTSSNRGIDLIKSLVLYFGGDGRESPICTPLRALYP